MTACLVLAFLISRVIDVSDIIRFLSCGTPSLYDGPDVTTIYIGQGGVGDSSCYCFIYTDAVTSWQNDQSIDLRHVETGTNSTTPWNNMTSADAGATPNSINGMKLEYTSSNGQQELTFRKVSGDVTFTLDDSSAMLMRMSMLIYKHQCI